MKAEDPKSVLVFSRTKHGANKIVKFLDKAGIMAEAIHSNKSQTARQRALNNFKKGETPVLVATDIAARGIDVDDLSYVINYDLPNIPETYIHRIGRTGRAGLSGIAVSFCDNEERPFLRDIQKLIGQRIPVVDGHPFENDKTTALKETEENTPGSKQSQKPNSHRSNQNRNKSRSRRRY